MVREIDVHKMEYKRLELECQWLKKGNQILNDGLETLTNHVRAADRRESQLRAKLMFTLRCFIVTNAALIVSIIGLLVHAIMSN